MTACGRHLDSCACHLCSVAALNDGVAVPVVLDLSARASSLAGRSRKVRPKPASHVIFMDTADGVPFWIIAVAGGPGGFNMVGGDPTAKRA